MTMEDRSGGPPREIAIEQGGGKPRIINCPECGAENIQGADYCVNCNSDLRTLDIPPETWSPGEGPPGVPVREIARGEPLTIGPETSVRDAIARLREGKQGCVVVVDDGRVLGVFTERDVLYHITPDRQRGLERSVAEVMTKDPTVMKADESILVAINEMSVGGFRHIPLVDENNLLRGIMTGRDIIAYVAGIAKGGS